MSAPPELLIVTESLALPWLDEVARETGFAPVRRRSVREAIVSCRRSAPAAVLAEYRFNPTYSSHTSTLESLIAGLQKYAPEARLLVVAETERLPHLRALQGRFAPSAVLHHPLRRAPLARALRETFTALGRPAALRPS